MSEEQTPSPENGAKDVLEELPKQFAEIGEHLGAYLGAKWARSKGSLRDGLFGLALSALLVLLIAGIFLTSIVFVLYGTALGLSEWLGGKTWAGFLLSGGILLLGGTAFLTFKIKSLRRASLNKKLGEYEQKLERQKEKYGINAVERASAPDGA